MNEQMQWVLIIDGQYIRRPMSLDEARAWKSLLSQQFPAAQIGIISWN